jgi:serine/threonine protein phosphatase PrpC
MDCNDIGTTACIAVILNDQLWTANVGDSRAFIVGQNNTVIPMTTDMKAGTLTKPEGYDLPESLANKGKLTKTDTGYQLEISGKPTDYYMLPTRVDAKRLTKRGGLAKTTTKFVWDSFHEGKNIFKPSQDIGIIRACDNWGLGILSVSGAIGDNNIIGMSPIPAIASIKLSDLPPGSYKLFMGCDGLTDIGSTKQLAQHLRDHWNQPNAATTLVEFARDRNTQDNTSALVVNLKSTI